MPRIIVDLTGGFLDGATFDSRSADADNAEAARWVHEATRGQRVGGRFTRRSPAASRRASEEKWSDERVAADLPAYEYEVIGWLEAGDEVLIRARFVGVEPRK